MAWSLGSPMCSGEVRRPRTSRQVLGRDGSSAHGAAFRFLGCRRGRSPTFAPCVDGTAGLALIDAALGVPDALGGLLEVL